MVTGLAISLPAGHCAIENRLNLYRNSLLPEAVSRLTVTQRFSAKHRHFIGKFHDETKA
jgi:hypothetical protein